MNKIICLPILLFSFLSLSAQKGIVFETNFTSWNEVLEKAQTLDKPIFVDVYTTWCGPCKLMDQTVFKDSEAGTYFNENFLCVKLDAEKGYGINFNKENKITGYPTYLFFTSTGDLVRSEIGAIKLNSFLSLGTNVMKDYNSGENLQAMEDKMQSGEYDSAFLVAYIQKLGKVKRINELAMEKYLSFLPAESLYSEDTYEFIRSSYNGWTAQNSKVFEVLNNAYKKYPIKSYELMKPWWLLNGRLLNNVDIAIEQKDSAAVKDIIHTYYKMYPDSETFRMNKENVYCLYFAGTKDSLLFLKYLNLYIEDNIMNVNNGSQQNIELEKYRAALKLKYGIDNEKLLLKEDLWFTKSYVCKYRLTLDQLKGIQFHYSKYLDKNPGYEKIISEAMKIALENYKNFTPNFNEYIYKLYSK